MPRFKEGAHYHGAKKSMRARLVAIAAVQPCEAPCVLIRLLIGRLLGMSLANEVKLLLPNFLTLCRLRHHTHTTYLIITWELLKQLSYTMLYTTSTDIFLNDYMHLAIINFRIYGFRVTFARRNCNTSLLCLYTALAFHNLTYDIQSRPNRS